jgi:hypothetical protein
VRALLLVPVVVLVIVGLAPGCGSPPPGSPGSTKPGAACAEAADCGCWSCTCKGIGGAPGGAQLCIAGKCPTAQQACAPVCAIVDAGVAQATSDDHCPAVP